MAPRQLAEVTDYPGLLVALRSRADELQVARETIDEISGLPARYSGKILGLKQVRRIGMLSLGPLLGALGVKLIMVEDAAALKLVAGRLRKRAEGCVRSATASASHGGLGKI